MEHCCSKSRDMEIQAIWYLINLSLLYYLKLVRIFFIILCRFLSYFDTTWRIVHWFLSADSSYDLLRRSHKPQNRTSVGRLIFCVVFYMLQIVSTGVPFYNSFCWFMHYIERAWKHLLTHSYFEVVSLIMSDLIASVAGGQKLLIKILL